MLILGLDPGTAATGYGFIKKEKGETRHIAHGVIKTPSGLAAAKRLFLLHRELAEIIKKYRPELAAVEKIFFFKNQKTVIEVAQARGVILAAAAQNKIKVAEFTPLEIKIAVCGWGRADKKQVQKMVQVLLKLSSLPQPDDAADALACALCAAYTKSY